jgi:hypothetical protein
MKSALAVVLAGTAAIGAAAPALAHHSAAMFDHTKKITLAGTVKEFQYTNPHSWLQVMVPETGKQPVLWGFEAEGPSTLLRAGIKAQTFRPGDKVTIVFNPMKDGRPAGALLTATKADGVTYSPRPSGIANGAQGS